MSKFKIATQAQGVAGLTDLCEIIRKAPDQAPFQEFTAVSGTDLNAAPIEAGLPRCAWQWESLSQLDIDILKGYCSGTSATVYIQTETNDGTTRAPANYLAVMHRPRLGELDPRENSRSVEIDFVNLQAQ